MLYIKPPRGDIALDELQECVTTRMIYFLHKYGQDSAVSIENVKFQYLVIGTAHDRIGHFMLRLLSANSYQLKEFVSLSEAAFIIERLEFSSQKEIIKLIKSTLRHMDEAGHLDGSNFVWASEIKCVLKEFECAFTLHHLVNFNHDVNCNEYHVKVPFQLCLKLVAKRELLLDKGKVIVPCGKWKKFLQCLCEAHVKKEIEKIESNNTIGELLSDERLKDLRTIVRCFFLRKSIKCSSQRHVNLKDMDQIKTRFPPCMGYLYRSLKVNHRLSHNARFSLSLFLKEIGMSLSESFMFWQNEYSKPSKCGGKCSHSWQKDSKRYMYSIRHLYGLEGKRANYCTPTCVKIQDKSLGATDEGGCPFSSFDHKTLENILDPDVVGNKEDLDKIMFFTSHGQATSACDYYRKALTKTATTRNGSAATEHKSPVEYFFILSECFNLGSESLPDSIASRE